MKYSLSGFLPLVDGRIGKGFFIWQKGAYVVLPVAVKDMQMGQIGRRAGERRRCKMGERVDRLKKFICKRGL